MFNRLLIANRGEIACRVIATARRLGIATVAVYSEADREARHVAMADTAVLIGPAAAAQSYLNGAAIIEAAQASGAEAIHPGYGFLSENADFAEACAAASLTFVGPPPAAIRAMGMKDEARQLMAKAGVPILPGFEGAEDDEKAFRDAADRIGYPVLIKAAAGGGGKGIRIVHKSGELTAALEAAAREATASFGSGQLILERYLDPARHIEVQVFADKEGETISLFERDCSIQRRYQKVVEEAPAIGLDEKRRAAMSAAAVAAAKAVGYVGAGTVEFICDAGILAAGKKGGKAAADGFYFMEMNTRLQVEHPVTEMVTGTDLVEWQLRVAAGEALPCEMAVSLNGHSIEARLYAESPSRDFMPAAGRISHLSLPDDMAHTRVDTGVLVGDEIGIHYDPMIAKLVVWGEDRPAAIRRLSRALAACEIAGIDTNISFLSALARQGDYRQGALETRFIDRHRDELLSPPAASPEVLALATLCLLAQPGASPPGDPYSPWNIRDGWQLQGRGRQIFELHPAASLAAPEANIILLTVDWRAEGDFTLTIDGPGLASGMGVGATVEIAVTAAGPFLNGRGLSGRAVDSGDGVTVFHDGGVHRFVLFDPAAVTGEAAAAGSLQAPMPGKVVAVKVSPAQKVKAGDPLVILEAMKMEIVIAAPFAGIVEEVHFATGEQVEEGMTLVALQPASGEKP